MRTANTYWQPNAHDRHRRSCIFKSWVSSYAAVAREWGGSCAWVGAPRHLWCKRKGPVHSSWPTESNSWPQRLSFLLFVSQQITNSFYPKLWDGWCSQSNCYRLVIGHCPSTAQAQTIAWWSNPWPWHQPSRLRSLIGVRVAIHALSLQWVFHDFGVFSSVPRRSGPWLLKSTEFWSPSSNEYWPGRWCCFMRQHLWISIRFVLFFCLPFFGF